MKSKLLLIAAITSILLTAAALRQKEYARLSSPAGGHIAIAKYRAYQDWLPMSPGSSGDKPGTITIISAAGGTHGTQEVDMISMIHDLQWSEQEAHIRLVANWNLTK